MYGTYKDCLMCGFVKDIGQIPEGVILVVEKKRIKRALICEGEKIG